MIRLLSNMPARVLGFEAIGEVEEDLKLGLSHPASFERIAVVTNVGWAKPAMRAFSLLFPGRAKAFRLAELEQATAWAAAD